MLATELALKPPQGTSCAGMIIADLWVFKHVLQSEQYTIYDGCDVYYAEGHYASCADMWSFPLFSQHHQRWLLGINKSWTQGWSITISPYAISPGAESMQKQLRILRVEEIKPHVYNVWALVYHYIPVKIVCDISNVYNVYNAYNVRNVYKFCKHMNYGFS